MSRKALVGGVLLLAGMAAGGTWAWKTWAGIAPRISRDRISPDPMPASPMTMDLEALVPKGAVVIAGVRNIPSLMGSFHASNFSKVYSGYVLRATARAARTYRAPYLNDPAALSERSALEILFEKSLVIAVYPPAGTVMPVTDMPHSVGPKIPPALLLFKIPLDITLESLVDHFPLFGHSPSGKGLRSRRQHMNVPIFDAALGLWAAVIPAKDGPVLALASDLETLKSCIGLSVSADPSESAARSDWVGEAFKRVPSDAFLYSLTRDDALKNLNLALKDLPSFTDWSVTSFSWKGGLASAGFNHLSAEAGNPYKDWAAAGPAGYDVLRLIPPESLLVVATNSLPASSAAALLQDALSKVKDMPPDLAAAAKRYSSALSGQLDEQAVLAYNGFRRTGSEAAHDAVVVLQLRSPLKARLLLLQASRELAARLEGKLFFALRGRWLILALHRESLEAALRAFAAGGKGLGSFPADLPERSNFVILADAYGIYRNILASPFTFPRSLTSFLHRLYGSRKLTEANCEQYNPCFQDLPWLYGPQAWPFLVR